MKEIFVWSKTDDKTVDETDGHETGGDEAGDKQPEATDMPDLESEESAEQKNAKRTRTKNINTRSHD